MRKICILLFGTLLATAACVAQSANLAHAVPSAAAGAGHFLVAGSLDVEFAFFAFQQKDGHVWGAFHHRTNDGLGNVEFYARVICLAVDRDLGRAWVGGVITANLSTSPDFTDQVHQPGHDIWFRVLDSEDSAHHADPDQPSRSTFIGFEGAIPSSAAYCASRPWPADNARTWPVTEGGIEVR